MAGDHATIGRALGREERAEALVADVEARFAKARDQHPEFTGKTGIVAYDFGQATLGAYGPQDPGRGFFVLGFEVPKPIADLAGDHFFAEISGEQMQLLDADAVVWIVFLEDCAKRRIRSIRP